MSNPSKAVQRQELKSTQYDTKNSKKEKKKTTKAFVD